VFERVDAGVHAAAHPLPGERVARHLDAVTVRLVDDGVNFVGIEPGIDNKLAARLEVIPGRRVQLDPVGAVVNLLAHHFSRFPWTIHRRVPRR